MSDASQRVMFVDDEPSVLAAFRRNLCETFDLLLMGSGAEAIAHIEREGPPAVILADMRMPGMSGVQLLSEVLHRWPDTVRMMLTGNSDQLTAVEAVNRGQVYRFLTKPCSSEEIAETIRQALEHHRVLRAERALLDGTLNGTVGVLSEVLALADPKAFGRCMKLRGLVRQIAQQLGFGSRWDLEAAALMSELGWITVPPEIVVNVRAGVGLKPAEAEVVARVSEAGADLLARIPRMGEVAEAIRYQDRKWDEDGVAGEAAKGLGGESKLPMGARILKVAKDFVRLEEEGLSPEATLGRMQRRMGWYDPKVLTALFDCLQIQRLDPQAEALRVHTVPLEEIGPGCVLMDDVRTAEGILIVTAGTQVTAPLLNRLRNFAATCGVAGPLRVRFPNPA